MNMKKSKLKKMTISAITATMVASTLVTALPFNVVASGTSTGSEGTKLTNLKSTSTNLLGAAANFDNKNYWTPIYWTAANTINDTKYASWDSYPGDSWDYFGVYSMSTKFEGNGSVQLSSPQMLKSMGIGRAFTTVPGHRYKISYTATNVDGNNNVAVVVNDGSAVHQALYNPLPLWMNIPNPGTWVGASGSQQTGEFVATSNSTSVSLETTTGTVRISNLSIVDLSDIERTTINSLTTDSTSVNGTAEPNADIVIKDQNNNQLATGKVSGDGTYQFGIPKQAAGTVVTAYVTANGVNADPASTTVTQGNLAPTTIDNLTTDSVKAEGTAEPNADMTIKVGQTTIATGKADASGHYSITIPKQTVGTVVESTATKNGKTSNTATTTVTQGAIAATTINSLTTDSVKAEGTAEPNADMTIKVGQTTIATGKADASGHYSITIPKQAVGTVVEATATKNGTTSNTASTTVTQGNLAPTTIGDLTTDSVKAEGTAEPNADMTIKVGQTTIATGRTDASGHYSITIPKQAVGTVVEATATKNGVTSNTATTTVTQGELAPTTIGALTTDSTVAQGNAEPNATIVIKDQNNNQLASGRVGSDGTYLLLIPKQEVGTVVTATATKNGKSSSASTTVTQGELAPTTIGDLTTDSTTARGTAEPNANIAIKVGQTTIATGQVGPDGNYSLTIPKQAVGTIVTATATKADKSASADTTVTQGEIEQTTIQALTTDSTTAQGTAEPNADIAITVGQTTIATGKVGSDGIYSLTIPKQPANAVVSATATVGTKTSSAMTIVSDMNIAQTTIDGLTTDSTSVTGHAEPNAIIVIKDQNNNQIASGLVGSDGIYSMTIAKQAAGTVVTATASAKGKTSSASTPVIDMSIAQTTINSLTADSTTAQGTAEPNASLVIKNQAGATIGTGTVGSDGRYTITIPKQAEGESVTATASAKGKTSSATTVVTAGTPIAATTINNLTTDSVKAEGTAEPNSDIVIKVGQTTIATGKVGSDGNYSLTIPKQAVGTIVTATATADGKTSSASTTVTQGNIAPTTIGNLTTDSVKAEGTAEPNASLVIKVGQTTIATGQVGPDGNYSITIPKQAVGTIVTATATKNGKSSSANTTVTQGNIAPTTINSLTTDSVKAEGTAEPNASLVIKVGQNTIATGTVASDGTYSVTIPKQAVGTVVTASATAKGKTESANTTVTQGNIAPTTINALDSDSTKAEGTAEPNADMVIKVGNTTIATGKADASGHYSITIPKQAAGTVVIATATKNGKSASANTTVTRASNGTVTVKDAYYVGYDTRVKAEVAGDVTKVYLEVDGAKKVTIPVTGSFEYYAKNDITSTTQTVYLVGLDSTNKELDRKRVTLKDGQLKIGAVAPDSFVVGIDAYVKGTYTGSVTKVAISVNGTTLSRIPVAADGTFQYYARPNITNAATDEVYAIGYNSEGDEISRKKVTLFGPESLIGSLTVNPNYFAVSTDSYVQGTFTGSVKYVSLVVNGTEYVKTPVKDANTWSYYSRGKIAMGDTVSVKGYNVAGVVVDEKQVNVILNPPGDSTITANNFVLYQDKYVTGTYTGSVKYIALKVNGTVLSKIPVSGGTYSYYARPNITSEEDVVSIIAYNSASVQVAEAPVRVSDSETTSAITANNYSIGDSSVIGTYSGDVKYISATVNGTELSKIPVDGSGTYNYYIRRYITSDTDTIVMNAYNSRNEIAKTTTVRINPSGPSAITAQTYNLGESSVVGTYSGDVKYISATVNDTELSKIPVDGSGTYDYYIRRYVTSDTDRIVMNAYNSRNEIAKTTPVNIGQTGPSAITAQTYNLGDSSVVGTYSGNVKYISATVNDTELSRIPVDGSGTYDYYIRRYVTSDQDTIVMKAYTAGGAEVASNRVTIPPTAPATLTTDIFTIGTSREVTGTSTNGVKYIALKVEGVVKSKIPVNADGSFTYYAKALLKTPGMQVSMIGYGGANNILVETPVTVR